MPSLRGQLAAALLWALVMSLCVLAGRPPRGGARLACPPEQASYRVEDGRALVSCEGEGPAQPMPGGMRLTLGLKVDLNRASLEDFVALPWVGPAIAQRIVEERARGPFASVDDLLRVKGIGRTRLEQLRGLVEVPEPPKGP